MRAGQEQASDSLALDVSLAVTQTMPSASGQFEIDGKAVVICNDQSSWSINRQTYDVQRTVLNGTRETSDIVADPENQGRGDPWINFKSFDRLRDANTSPVNQSEHIRSSENHPHGAMNVKRTLILSLGALGIVYGYIGTSPLYTVKTMFASVPVNNENIIGGISTLVWLINIIVTFKYVLIVLRANDQGEGGIMVLTALATKSSQAVPVTRSWWKGIVTILGDACKPQPLCGSAAYFISLSDMSESTLCARIAWDYSVLRRLRPHASHFSALCA